MLRLQQRGDDAHGRTNELTQERIAFEQFVVRADAVRERLLKIALDVGDLRGLVEEAHSKWWYRLR